jgi:hypothetical protein
MSKILYGTHFVSTDEPCVGLFEVEEQSPMSKGFHRYQVVYVLRGDKPAEYRIDMGSIKKWKGVSQLRIPGGAEIDGKFYIEETVGRLRDIADMIRGEELDMRERIGLENIRTK